ncbi:MAG: isoprenyl transferase [Candidatus Omnitrophota bacterium]|nr:isoprenyl transferase [Candidatus Omnitrophota bacterium]
MGNNNDLPRHIAIILDGNGRWAKERGLHRSAGHRAGIERVDEVIEAAAKIGIEFLTFFAFSTENWSRPKREVNLLMRYLDDFLKRRIQELHKENIRFKWIGRSDPLSKKLQKSLLDAQALTSGNSGMTVVLALNYGARQEITDAAKSIAVAVSGGSLDPADINEQVFGEHLYTAGLPDPDLLIRTSEVMRVSNFLLWQISYAELYFPQKNWPDFSAADLEEAVEVYRKRERRFGRVDARQKDN